MLNKKIVKKNIILSISLMILFSFLISACGNNMKDENESTAPTTTLSYKESLEESMEKESIRKESFESFKESVQESKRIEDESINESINIRASEVESMLQEEREYRETRDEYIKNKRESIKNINIDEIVNAYRESKDNEEVTNEN